MSSAQPVLLGVDHRTAPLAVRERLAFDREQAAALLRAVAAARPGVEAMVLSTCNRTEFYVVGTTDVDPFAGWHEIVRDRRPDAPPLDDPCWRRARGRAAVGHLARVACGLESAILGDGQVVAQVRAAAALARDAGTLGPGLGRAVHAALRAARRARRDTDIALGAPGVGSAVVDAVEGHRPGLGAQAAVVILGTGDAARAIGRHLRKRGSTDLTVVGRSEERAGALAEQLAGRALPWRSLPEALAAADVLVVATGASEPVVRADALGASRRDGARRPLLVVDAGFPPNVAPDVPAEVVPLGALRERDGEVLARRRAAVETVEAIVEEETRAWGTTGVDPLAPLVKALHLDVGPAARDAAARLAALGPIPADGAELVVRRALERLVHDHVARLRAADLSGAR